LPLLPGRFPSAALASHELAKMRALAAGQLGLTRAVKMGGLESLIRGRHEGVVEALRPRRGVPAPPLLLGPRLSGLTATGVLVLSLAVR
jgi:hypothetical protein